MYFRLFFAIFRFVVTVAATSYATVNHGALIGLATLFGSLIGCLIFQVILAYFLFAPISAKPKDPQAIADKNMEDAIAVFGKTPTMLPSITEKYAALRFSNEDLILISIMTLAGWVESERTAENLVLSNGLQTQAFQAGSCDE
jgi:hypothetical protein